MENNTKISAEFLRFINQIMDSPAKRIKGLTELASEMNKNIELEEILSSISSQSQKLENLIKDFLLYLKLQNTELLLNKTYVHGRNIINSLEKIQQANTSNTILFENNYSRLPLDLAYYCDVMHFENILHKLIYIATKYHRKDVILCELSLEKQKDISRLRIMLQYKGKGFDEKFIEYIKDPACCTDKYIISMDDEAGLPFVILHKLLDKMGGDSIISSDRNIGTRMNILIPVKTADNISEEEKLYKHCQDDLMNQEFHILLLEDNNELHKILQQKFVQKSWKIDIVTSVEEAINNMSATDYDVFIFNLDIALEEFQSLIQSVRRHNLDIPIFAFLHLVPDELSQILAKDKKLEIIKKPISQQGIFGLIYKHLCKNNVANAFVKLIRYGKTNKPDLFFNPGFFNDNNLDEKYAFFNQEQQLDLYYAPKLNYQGKSFNNILFITKENDVKNPISIVNQPLFHCIHQREVLTQMHQKNFDFSKGKQHIIDVINNKDGLCPNNENLLLKEYNMMLLDLYEKANNDCRNKNESCFVGKLQTKAGINNNGIVQKSEKEAIALLALKEKLEKKSHCFRTANKKIVFKHINFDNAKITATVSLYIDIPNNSAKDIEIAVFNKIADQEYMNTIKNSIDDLRKLSKRSKESFWMDIHLSEAFHFISHNKMQFIDANEIKNEFKKFLDLNIDNNQYYIKLKDNERKDDMEYNLHLIENLERLLSLIEKEEMKLYSYHKLLKLGKSTSLSNTAFLYTKVLDVSPAYIHAEMDVL